jgi:hypothetical protein
MPTLAIVRIRWRPVAPLGIPHATTKADVYGVYDIPKGATVYANIEYVLTFSFSQAPYPSDIGDLTVFWLRTQMYSMIRRRSILLAS